MAPFMALFKLNLPHPPTKAFVKPLRNKCPNLFANGTNWSQNQAFKFNPSPFRLNRDLT